MAILRPADNTFIRLRSLSHLILPNMAAHEDIQKSSSMPSTPQSFLYFEADSPYPQSTNEEIWPNSKRRRTQRTSSETQFIHMNGYKSDSHLGTRFNNTYVDSYSEPKANENAQNRPTDAASNAASPEDDVPMVVESALKVNEERSERGEPASTKSTRSTNRKPVQRSTETSSRVLKVKSGTGSSQQTNIQTFIFKTKLDPRLAYRDRSDEPATPSSSNDNSEVKLEIAPVAATANATTPSIAEPAAKSTRKTRKSEANMLKFKSYTPNAAPALRNAGRKFSQQFQDTESPIAIQRSPTCTTEDFQTVVERKTEPENSNNLQNSNQLETPLKDGVPVGDHEGGSTQRRSNRIRKPVSTIMLGETRDTPRKQKAPKETGSTSNIQKAKTPGKSAAVQLGGATTPVPETGIFGSSRDGTIFERFETPSPDGLSANTRTSGRVRKPTIKAIEALQSKPKSRKRLRDSDQFANLAEEASTLNQATLTPEPAIASNASTVSMSRSDSGVGSEAMSLSFIVDDDTEFLSRQLYELASKAFVDGISSANDDQAKVEKWRAAFNREEKDKEVLVLASADEVPEGEAAAVAILENFNDLPGEVNEDIPLEHPDRPRPWTEEGGWIHTGRVNKHGEEYCLASAEKYKWVAHASNYRTPTGPIPNPPPYIKSVDEIRRDNIYGFPPSPGQRNMYQRHPGQVWRYENLEGLAGYLGSTDSSGYGSGHGDSMSIEEPGRKTRYINRKGLPRFKRPLKIVFVDSTKIDRTDGGASANSSLRKNRQSAPAAAGKVFAGSSSRKRSLDMTGLAGHADSPSHQHQQRKKRQSMGKATDDKKNMATPVRQKRHTTITFTNKAATPLAAPKSAAKMTPKGHSVGTRTTNSEKATAKIKSSVESFVASPNEETTAPATTAAGRAARRRTWVAPKTGE